MNNPCKHCGRPENIHTNIGGDKHCFREMDSVFEPSTVVPALHDPERLAVLSAIQKVASNYIDWDSFSRHCLDYDPDYKPEFPAWLVAAKRAVIDTPDPTAEQVGAVLDFATVSGITNHYAASLQGSAARMSAEAFCRFCVLHPEQGPAAVYESILPCSRPSYGDILACVNWLSLGLAPEAMEYRPLRAVREWVLGYAGGSEK